MNESTRVSILIADDDPDDRMLIDDAFDENGIDLSRYFVEDGEQLVSFLRREGQFAPLVNDPLPQLIILDLNMPKVDGRSALSIIKRDVNLSGIPVIVMSTSKADEDINICYDLGVNSFIRKPVSFDELVYIVELIGNYWMKVVVLPRRGSESG